MAKVADVFVKMLIKAGVTRVYRVAGDSLNGLTDSIRAHDRIDWMMVRHEEMAAFAACGESQVTGQLTVCAGSCGPGNLHLINGLQASGWAVMYVLLLVAALPHLAEQDILRYNTLAWAILFCVTLLIRPVCRTLSARWVYSWLALEGCAFVF